MRTLLQASKLSLAYKKLRDSLFTARVTLCVLALFLTNNGFIFQNHLKALPGQASALNQSSNPSPLLTAANSNHRIQRSLVLIQVSPRSWEALRPWVQGSEPESRYTGVVLPNRKILVHGPALFKPSYIQVSKHSSYKKYLAKLSFFDKSTNLAILSIDAKHEQEFFSDLRPLSLGNDLTLYSYVTAAKVDTLFQIHREHFRISEVDMLSNLGFVSLPYYLFRSQEPFASGGIFLCRLQLCGMIRSFNSEGNRGQAFLASTLKSFLDSFERFKKDSKKLNKPSLGYSKFISAGLRLVDLVDPSVRSYYGISQKCPQCKGALVSKVYLGTSAWGHLKENDIVLEINGNIIDEFGFYKDPRWGLQSALLLFVMQAKVQGGYRKQGDELKLKIFRSGKVQELQISLSPYTGKGERIPRRISNQAPYLIENGLIFSELSVPLLEQFYGKNWKSISSLMNYIYQNWRYYTSSFYFKTPLGPSLSEQRKNASTSENNLEKQSLFWAKDAKILVLNYIFPDASTEGLSVFRSKIIDTVHGKRMATIRDMSIYLDQLTKQGVDYANVRLIDGRFFYLNLKDRDNINQRIATKYRITKLRHY